MMYEHIIDKLIGVGIAEELPEHIWVNTKGYPFEEKDAFGCKVRHCILYPDYSIVGDEVGGNLLMKGDGGRTKYLVGRGNIAQEKASSNNHHFTEIGLTLLTGALLIALL